MLLAHQAIPGRFEVATVDHRLRVESAGEAAMVARLCAERGIPHRTLACEVARKGNLQANARAARYAALAGWIAERKLDALVTAHHLDDQAETLLMRLNRGAGVRGLAGMQPIAVVPDRTGACNLRLWRPLLGWRRAELAEIVADAGMTPTHDPSNDDPRFERTRARAVLAAQPWLDPVALAASAAHLAQAEDAIAHAAGAEWNRCLRESDGSIRYDPEAPPAVVLRVVEMILAGLASEGTPRGKEIARLVETLTWGGSATLAGVKASADRGGNAWRFAPAPPRRG
jgi:tRNA(Ile)-lysidine synthase